MSDPMTNTEVEDVLASIRRLVSDDNRLESKPVQNVVADRLVLTPSLRVMEDDRTGAPDPDTPPAVDPRIMSDQMDEAGQDDIVGVDDAPAPKDTVQAVVDQEDDSQDETDASRIVAQDDDANTQEHIFIDDAHLDVENAAIDLDAQLVADSADLQVAEDVSDDELQEWPSVSDGTPDAQMDLDAQPTAEDMGDIASPEDAVTDDAPFILVDATDDLDGIAEILAAPATQTLSEKVAALETLVGKRSENFEPDDLNVGANAGTEPPAMEWEDADVTADEAPAFADTTTEDAPIFADAVADDAPTYAAFVGSQPKAEPEEHTPSSQLFSNDEDIIDEEALRELASDIVREELQGALGERITRNVRKLVRREIHRAMAAQDLE